MKKIILFLSFMISFFIVKAQSYLPEEGFNNGIPNTWTVTDAGDTTDGSDTWLSASHNGNNNLNGTNGAFVDSDDYGNGPHLIETLTSPAFDSSSATFLFLDFQQYYRNIGADVANVEVYDGTNWIPVLSQSSSAGGWGAPDNQHIDITAYKNAAMQIRFHYDDKDVWAWYWMVDNVHVYNEACASPSGISTSNIGQNSADITWSQGGTETSWEIIVQPSGTGSPTGSGTVVNTTSYNATGLNPSSSYEVYIRSNCGTDGYSIWFGPTTFITLNAPPAPSPVNFSQTSLTTSGTNRAVVDMNGDFLDDIVSINNSSVNILFQNTTGGGFTTRNISTPSANYSPSWSLASGDYDADGYNDLLYGAGSGVSIMRTVVNNANVDNGDPFDDVTGFTQISNSGIFSQRSNFIDINNDGHLDAFVCHDVAPNVYYINDGSGNLSFYQTTITAGAPYNLGDYSSGGNYGSVWIDYDNDGDLDMFIAKCGGETARRTNQMHTNNGGVDIVGGDLTTSSYTENALALGLADPMQTWSSAWGDFDNDGDMDVFVGASSGVHKMMRNDFVNDMGLPQKFTDVTSSSGVLALSDTGIENVPYDFDNDGNLDIASNGNILFGNGDLTFSANENMVTGSGSFGDLNNDGFIDAFGGGTLYLNQTTTNNWVKINTTGLASSGYSNINGIGARIILETPAGKQIRDVRSGEGFRHMNTLNSHFGIGTETSITSITIEWPSGIVDTILNPAINSTVSALEGENQLSVEEFLVNDLIMYPNPTKGLLNLNTGYLLEKSDFIVFDITGRLVFKGLITDNKIDVSRLEAGSYILKISNGGASRAQKFIKL